MKHPIGVFEKIKTSSGLEFPVEWSWVLGVSLFCEIWRRFTPLRFPHCGSSLVKCFLIFVLIKTLYLKWIGIRFSLSDQMRSILERVFLGTEYLLLFIVNATAFCVLSYLCCTWHYPLADRELGHLDQLLGLDWTSLSAWSLREPMRTILQVVYSTLINQFIFFAIWFAFLRDKDRLREVFWILFLALFLTITISGFLPALGPAAGLGVTLPYTAQAQQDMAVVASIRAGIAPLIVISNLAGIIAFPSFHTVAAIVLMYAFRKNEWLSLAVVLLNMGMLISIPTFGNHYFTDMMGGAGIAAISLIMVRKWKWKTPTMG